MRRILLCLLLTALLYLTGCGSVPIVQQISSEVNVQQISPKTIAKQMVNNDVMPADIVTVLNAKESGDERSVDNNILAAVELPRSLSISIPNIDMTKVHDTHLLQKSQVDTLKSRGFSNEAIEDMDFGDYKNIEKTWILDPEILPKIKGIYPQLVSIDISKWTNGDFLEYSMEADAKTYAPTTEQASAIKARNITLADARTLLKDFQSYDTILTQDDGTLKEHIEGYYQMTIDYIKQLAQFSK